MAICIMMIGVPGSGKSTKVKELLEKDKNITVVSSDEYIEIIAKKLNKSYNEVYSDNINDAISWMNNKIQLLIKNKENFIWDQTNIVKSARLKKLKNLKSNGYKVNAICFEISKEELFLRLEKREKLGEKVISKKIIENMINSYEKPDLLEGFNNINIIADTTEYFISQPRKTQSI